ncbi:MAG: hypothetical protein NZ869_00100 [Thermoanaerobaculum sp.]|nr:hypothetical protein [Thermoanaerobaculum sp.]MDW7967982.1 hypothetical protein [Thermoanaerobaculum sp.]
MTVPLLLTLAAAASVGIMTPGQVVLEPVTAQELASGALLPLEGGATPLVLVVERTVRGAFRLEVPQGFPISSLELKVQFAGSGWGHGGVLRPQDRGSPIPVRVTLLPLRLVEVRADREVWEGDLLLQLDLSRALAGTFTGELQLMVAGR